MKIICVRRKILYSLHKEDYPKDKEGYPQANGELAVRLSKLQASVGELDLTRLTGSRAHSRQNPPSTWVFEK